MARLTPPTQALGHDANLGEATEQADIVIGGSSHDTVDGHGGDDIIGGSCSDVFQGNRGRLGGSGDDFVRGRRVTSCAAGAATISSTGTGDFLLDHLVGGARPPSAVTSLLFTMANLGEPRRLGWSEHRPGRRREARIRCAAGANFVNGGTGKDIGSAVIGHASPTTRSTDRSQGHRRVATSAGRQRAIPPTPPCWGSTTSSAGDGANTARHRSRAGAVTTSAKRATTPWKAARVATGSSAARATTRSTAEAKTTFSTAARATTRSPAGRRGRLRIRGRTGERHDRRLHRRRGQDRPLRPGRDRGRRRSRYRDLRGHDGDRSHLLRRWLRQARGHRRCQFRRGRLRVLRAAR